MRYQKAIARVLKVDSVFSDGIPAEQTITLKLFNGIQVEAFVQTSEWLDKSIENQNAEVVLIYGLCKLKKINSSKKQIFVKDNAVYGQIETIWKDGSDNYATLDAGTMKITLWLFRDPSYEYPPLKKGNFVKVYDGRWEVDTLRLIKNDE